MIRLRAQKDQAGHATWVQLREPDRQAEEVADEGPMNDMNHLSPWETWATWTLNDAEHLSTWVSRLSQEEFWVRAIPRITVVSKLPSH